MRLVAPLLALAACDAEAPTTSILPDQRLIAPRPVASGAWARSTGTPSPAAQLTREVADPVRTAAADVLELIDVITAYPYVQEGPRRRWGPWQDDGLMGQLWMTTRPDGATDWTIELAVADGGWQEVVTGTIDGGATPEVSEGRLDVDLTALAAWRTEEGWVGLHLDYALRGALAAIDVDLDGPWGARGAHLVHDGREARLDVAVEEDWVPLTSEPERWTARSRWTEAGAGRADALLSGGDLGLLTFTESECWSPLGLVVFHTNNHALVTEGREADCAFPEASYPGR